MQNQFNQFVINRYPQNQSNLQAWDSADEYLLSELGQFEDLKSRNILIFNDAFGALSVSLSELKPTTVTDSYISHQAIQKNLELNGVPESSITLLNPLDEIRSEFNIVLIKIPKSMDDLIYFLSIVQKNLHTESKILLAGMMKHIPKNLWDVLQQYGECSTLPGVKKAKLLYFKFVDKITSPYPNYFKLPDSETKVFNHANVFSKNSLDIGTRFLLDNLPKMDLPEKIIDLACGNGVIGLSLAKIYPQAEITFTDESFMAVESARLTMKANFNDLSRFKFITTDCLDGFEKNSCDLIVNNPPFHQNSTIGTFIAEKMFRQSKAVLNKNGVLIVVANRHLPYFHKLKKLFKNTQTIASNQKFNIFKSSIK